MSVAEYAGLAAAFAGIVWLVVVVSRVFREVDADE